MKEYFFNFQKIEYLTGKKPQGCVLCLIQKKSEEVTDLTVWSNYLFTVSVNLYPYNPGHLIVFPNRHIEDIRDYTVPEEHYLTIITKHLLNLLDSTHSPSAYNIGYNMGITAGASISHLHLHIIPRFPCEIGIADILAGKRVLVESPDTTQNRLIDALTVNPFPFQDND